MITSRDISFQMVMLRGRKEGKQHMKCKYYRDVEIENTGDIGTFCGINLYRKINRGGMIVVHPYL